MNLRRNLLATLKTQESEGAASVPSPARTEDWRIQHSLLQNGLHGFRLQEMENVAEWKTMLLGQRDIQPVVRSCGLQFEVEANAEALAQSQSPGLVDAAAKWRVNHQLHAAPFIEETLGDDGVLRGHRA